MVLQIEGGKGHTIRKALDNGSRASEVVVSSGGSQPFDMAIDFVGRLLFWTCSHANSINVTRFVLFNWYSVN